MRMRPGREMPARGCSRECSNLSLRLKPAIPGGDRRAAAPINSRPPQVVRRLFTRQRKHGSLGPLADVIPEALDRNCPGVGRRRGVLNPAPTCLHSARFRNRTTDHICCLLATVPCPVPQEVCNFAEGACMLPLRRFFDPDPDIALAATPQWSRTKPPAPEHARALP